MNCEHENRRIHLVCNAHLDPVWQWEWEEGLAEALSTFSIAADFCEQYDEFVFNHNEALLYMWVEQYDPPLFERIKKLVDAGKWHIMGGWYLQPCCVTPSGESILRQIEVGRRYFYEKFGKIPRTAINVDSFGHDRGLVQILKKTGYTSYLVGRPTVVACNVPDVDFIWVGFDGSEIPVHLCEEGYNSLEGRATEKTGKYIETHKDRSPLVVLWGIGNHGGGPSKVDLEDIIALQDEYKKSGKTLIQSTPEQYFSELNNQNLARFSSDITPVMVGCYTSQVKIKQIHKELENLLWQTEKMSSFAEKTTLVNIDWSEIEKAEEILLFNEFHDILPGSSIQRAEKAALYSMGGGIDVLKKQRMKAFMSLVSLCDTPPLEKGDIPIYIFNAHPYLVNKIIECEFHMQDQNWEMICTNYDVYHHGKLIPSQLVKEDSNIPLDWRKKIAVDVELEPFSMTFLHCKPRKTDIKEAFPNPEKDIILEGENAKIVIDKNTGWIKSYSVDGFEYVNNDACKLLVLEDNEDPWTMTTDRYDKVCGEFALANSEETGWIAGLSHPINAVRIIEQGNVKTVVEAIFVYKKSHAVVKYSLGRFKSDIEVNIQIVWTEPNRVVKMALPTTLNHSKCYGQGMFGYGLLFEGGRENVAQQWLVVCDNSHALSIINSGTYASDFSDGLLRQTIVRSPAYCAHPIEDRNILPQDRYLPRIDIGMNEFNFTIKGDSTNEIFEQITVDAMIFNEVPFALSVFKTGSNCRENSCNGMIAIDNKAIQLVSLKRVGDDYEARLFNSSSQNQKCLFEFIDVSIELEFDSFEFKTIKLSVNSHGNKMEEISLYSLK